VWRASTGASLGNAGADLTTVWCCSTPFGLTLGDEAVQDGGSAARCSCNGGVDLLVSRGDAGGGASMTFMVRGTMRCVAASVVVLSAGRASVRRWVATVLVAMGTRR
jgi:hypothetical protein